MALRDDIRNALGSICSTLPDATHTMRHGEGETGQAVQASSREFASPVTEDAPVESARFIVNAGDFPTLDEGEAVEVDGSLRVVVSMKQDPLGATDTIGLSSPFEKCAASYSGRRRTASGPRSIYLPLDVLFIENGTADNYANPIAPTYATSYTVAVRREDWPEVTDPEIGDAIDITPGGIVRPLKVSAVTRHDGWFMLKCRSKE